MIELIAFNAGSNEPVSGLSVIWTVLCSFASAGLLLKKELADLIMN